jgi:hypothetical protein
MENLNEAADVIAKQRLKDAEMFLCEVAEMKTETPKHTPTPWTYERNGRDVYFGKKPEAPEGYTAYLIGSSCVGKLANRKDANAEANAEFIVRAVNAHEDLLHFARIAAEYCMSDDITDDGRQRRDEAGRKLLQIIALAEGPVTGQPIFKSHGEGK